VERPRTRIGCASDVNTPVEDSECKAFFMPSDAHILEGALLHVPRKNQ
jgi:hypothetical protein